MEYLNLMYWILAFAIMTMIEKLLSMADKVKWAIEDYEVFDTFAKFLSFCIGNLYCWQTVATLGFCHYLCRLGAKSPPPIPVDVSIAVDVVDADGENVGITTDQLLEEQGKAFKDTAVDNDEPDKQNAMLRAKVDRVKKELEFISKDRYELIKNMHIPKPARGLSVMAPIQGRI